MINKSQRIRLNQLNANVLSELDILRKSLLKEVNISSSKYKKMHELIDDAEITLFEISKLIQEFETWPG